MRISHDAPEDAPPTRHHQRFWIGELRFHLGYGLSDAFAMDVQLPYRVTRTTVKFRHLDGGSLPPDYESIHHRNETLQGPGDARVGGLTGGSLLGVDLFARAGLTVPLGSTEPDPFELGDEGKRHQHIQLGTGTFDPFLDLDLRRRIGPLTWGLRGGALLPWQQNEHGYRAGARFNGAIESSLPAWRNLHATLRVDLSHEEPERWDGRIHEEGNLGRTDLLVGGAVAVPAGAYNLSLDVGVPVWHRVRGAQLEYPAIVGIGITRSFGGTADP